MYTEPKYLVVAADDLGRSSSVNEGIIEAYDRGIVTASSIMAGGDAFHEAAGAALERGRLSVGLHVTLCDGRAVLPPSSIPDIANPDGFFAESPAEAWMKLSRKEVLQQVEMEVEAQFARLEATGIHVSYVDGHHHLHMHPRVFGIVCRLASKRGITWIRIPNEPLAVVFRLRARLRGAMPFIEWAVFGMLGTFNLKTAEKYGLRCADNVYGLSRTGNIDEQYLINVLYYIDGRVNEIFTHPDSAEGPGRRELQALTSADVSSRMESLGIRRVGYKDICRQSERIIRHDYR